MMIIGITIILGTWIAGMIRSKQVYNRLQKQARGEW